MRRVVTLIAGTVLMWASSQALCADAPNQSSSKRQLIGQMISCMKKRMYADRAVSYNEAAKTCKAQIVKQSENATSGPLVASDTPPKR